MRQSILGTGAATAGAPSGHRIEYKSPRWSGAVRVCVSLVAGLALGACVNRPGERGTVPAPEAAIQLSVDNRYTSPAKIYLRLGSLRIHLLTVAAGSRGETRIPEEFAGLKAKMTVWIPSESYTAATDDFVLAPGARLELSITPSSPPLIVRRSS